MNRQELFAQIQLKESYLCVGLDTDIQKIPAHLHKEKDPVFEFNRQIIDRTQALAVAYKPNIAFYEAQGARGWESLQRTIEYIPKECFTIADAKRGDIGNTSGLYARTFFDKNSSGLDFHSVTVAPYMGYDSVTPFLNFEGKWVILLALTSNEGASDFQQLTITQEFSSTQANIAEQALLEKVISRPLYEEVLRVSQSWGTPDNLMYVVGATKAEKLAEIRKIVPYHFLLVPGVGSQGGSLADVSKFGMNAQCGLLVNSSRAIIYASKNDDFAQKAQVEAQKVQEEMKKYLDLYL